MNTSIQNDQPIALRRKRRASTALSSPQKPAPTSILHEHEDDLTKTPSKSKKRVRFSDPGPDSLCSSSTGITPHMRRTKLLPNTPRPLQPLRRRSSTPSLSNSTTTTPPDTPISPAIELQFAAVDDLLDERFRRRLCRDMRSEMSSIEAERKESARRLEELNELKRELARVGRGGSEAVELVDVDNQERVRELEEEIEALKDNRRTTSEGAEQDIDVSRDEDAVSLIDFRDDHGSADVAMLDYPTPPTPTYTSTSEMGTQTTPSQSSIASLQAHIEEQNEHLIRARMDLEHLFPGETALPLQPDNNNSAPVLQALLDRLHAMKSKIQTTASSHSALQTQESNLRAQFNTTLTQLSTCRDQYRELRNGSEKIARKYLETKARMKDLEQENEEGKTSVERLGDALDKYRKDVRNLEDLVTQAEDEGKEKLEKLKEETDDTIADLECMVAAESRGRKDAEAECDSKNQRVESLEKNLSKVQGRWEKDVGSLNARLAEVHESLSSAQREIAGLNSERKKLVRVLDSERKAGTDAVQAVRDELGRLMETTEGIGEGYAKGAKERGEVVVQRGLLTPTVEGGRFRDIASESSEGQIVVKRGKGRKEKRVDSGVGLGAVIKE